MNNIPTIYLFIYQCKCIRKNKMIFSTLLNKTQCVSVICAASADANKSKETDGTVCVIINVFTRDSNMYSSAPRTMLNVRIKPAVLFISSLLDCEINDKHRICEVRIEYVLQSSVNNIF